MITADEIQTLDDRALKWYRKHITQFHQECLQFDKWAVIYFRGRNALEPL